MKLVPYIGIIPTVEITVGIAVIVLSKQQDPKSTLIMRIKLTITIIERLVKLLFNKDYSKEIKRYILLFAKIRKESGLKYCISYFKVCKLHITRYMCDKPLFANDKGVSLDSNGFPKRLLFLKDMVDNDPRIALTILGYQRSIIPNKKEESKVVPDYSSITDPYKGKEWTIPKFFIKDFVTKNNLSLNQPTYSDNSHYVSMKGSPNGKASYSSFWSIITLDYNLLQCIYNIVGDYGSNIDQLYKTSFEKYNLFKIKSYNWCNGKLSIVKDPELKRRVIAMVDYTSQFTLKPIHEDLLSLLKSRFPCDRTFTQDPFHDWKDDGNYFYSLDLSSATDRFPIKLQSKFLMYIYKENYTLANSWENLLINRNFQVGQDSTKYLRYSVGQPMGAYSSWAAFTITHHLVVHYAAYLCGYNDFKDYILLGDDIVIKNNKVANKYITLMTRLGVDISQSKTHVSKDTYEFAKRWIRNGQEITGIPLKGLLNNWTKPQVVYLEIFSYIMKVSTSRLSVIDICCKLYSNLPYSKRIKSFRSMYKLLYDFHHAIRYTFNLITYDELRAYLSYKTKESTFNCPPESLIPSFMKATLSEGMVGEAVSSNKVLEAFKSLENKFNDLEDINVLKDWPLIHGYYNHLRNLKGHIKDYNDESVTLLDSAMALRINHFDKIVNMHRNKSEQVTVLSKLWRKSISLLNQEVDEWTLMFKPHLNEERVLPVAPWESTLDTNIQFTINKFQQLISGEIPIKQQDPWAALMAQHGCA
uniref:RNA-dependent RNA polymerase n=1 Tax=Suillus luteus mitovirus 4 TaxID=3067813 RepID=A0AA50AEY3_9VIRU|nr:RNA-dependent RNA polymerase [Suillus luteus mitovirus 4]